MTRIAGSVVCDTLKILKKKNISRSLVNEFRIYFPIGFSLEGADEMKGKPKGVACAHIYKRKKS